MTPTLPPDARIALLRQALLANPPSAMLLYRLAEALAEIGEAQESNAAFTQAYRLNPSAGSSLLSGASFTRSEAEKLRDRATGLIEHGLAVGEAWIFLSWHASHGRG